MTLYKISCTCILDIYLYLPRQILRIKHNLSINKYDLLYKIYFMKL